MVAITIVIISQANQYSEHLIEINYLCIKNISSITTKSLNYVEGNEERMINVSKYVSI